MAGLMKMSQRVLLGWDRLQVYYRTYQENGTEHFRSLLQNISGAYHRAYKELITKAYYRVYKEHVTYHIRRTFQSMSAACIVQNIPGEFYRAYQEHVTNHIRSLLQSIS